ncbi:phage regulatory CII family protein [Arcobacter sp.]|uniref:phage regulatory CII family protein n=1 Tax=unclassified Arcobacter TaxID=2593671 RepID=UPI003AFFA4D7
MKEYKFKKDSKDSRFLSLFRKSFNKDRLNNSFTVAEAAHELGMSESTYEAKLKPSNNENDITVSEWNQHLELCGDFSTLEYFAGKHGFELKKLDVLKHSKNTNEINIQVDVAMIEFGEAFKESKESLMDEKVTMKEKIKSITEIDEAIKALQQLKQDFENKETEEE